MSRLLEVQDVSVSYGDGARAVEGADFHVEPGDCVVILGPNGAGKTSLLRSICGFLPHERVRTDGQVRFAGKPLSGRSVSRIARSGITYIPERDKVFRELTIRENLQVFSLRAGAQGPAAEDLALVFELFPALAEIPSSRRAGLLSGGQQQMLALAGALVARPQLLLVDEPSLGLAPILVADVMRALGAIMRERALAVVLVDQNIRSTAALATDLYTMSNGRLTHETGADVYERLVRDGYSRART